MKIFAATKKSQGTRENDFSFVPEGEIVYPSWTCTSGTADDECGCRRCLTGVRCGKGTTTFTAVDSPMTKEQYEKTIKKALLNVFGRSTQADDTSLRKNAVDIAGFLLRMAAKCSVGDVLEYRSGRFAQRIATS